MAPMSRTPTRVSRNGAAASTGRATRVARLPEPTQIIASHELLGRAESRLRESDIVTDSAEAFSALYQSALRAAGAVLAVSEHPTRRRGSRSAWARLPQAMPDLSGWATYFAGLSRLRADTEAGIRSVTDEQIAQLRPKVDEFLHVVEMEILRIERGKPSNMPAGAA
ncbi:SAV_6107 family HEPN domain-containing protein [Nocardia sp. 348MFTsu5.1]|uniref:SAV_6107 family HEPN domain-containing protein n=1 Tax=Nocardia sp. 348MFTsu5.1 TaxID=1172185 RepID=UPI0012DD449C|nr:SAV_6107 family HEPN domain-containing protein [Nocardia sp. 348MFTsu5.1]